MWLNGKQLKPFSSQTACCIWNPLAHWYSARFNKGENRIVIEYAKKTREPMLSFDVYRENVARRPGFSAWQVDLATVL